MDVSRLLENLNDAQRNAVTSDSKHLLILAGAGSGKTKALVHRIAWLIQVANCSSSSLLAVTFTNKAAKEMRYRIGDLMKVSTHGMWVGTFHGIAHRLLKAHWHDAGLPQNFQIIDSEDQLRMVKRIVREMELDEQRFSPKSLQWYINGCKDEGKRARHIEAYDYFEKTQLMVYAEYEKACSRGGQVDFGELLLRSHELWLEKPELLNHYQQRFRHILVDEFQDTNTIQYAWLRVLAGAHTDVTVVGDDDQSIYGWRGAKIANIQQFSDDFPDTELVKLEQNYRSTSTILDAANAVIANNNGRLGKDLWTDHVHGEPIQIYAGFNEQDEARYVVDRISSLCTEGANYQDHAILYRSNAQSRVFEEALIKLGMPYRIYGGQRFYDRMEIKNAVAYLRLAYQHDDDTAFERIINTPTRGIGSKTVDTIRFYARENGLTLWRASKASLEATVFSPRAAKAIKAFLQMIEELGDYITANSLEQSMERALEVSDLIAFHGREPGEKGRTRVENLQELLSAAKLFQPEEESLAIREFLDTAALDAGEQQADEHTDAVQLMTLHSAKGLEFPTVFLPGLEEGLFPHRNSSEDPDQLEEERRLCYVGITRARKNLTICYAESRRWYGQEQFNAVSRFVREIPDRCVEEVRLDTAVRRPVFSAASRSAAAAVSAGEDLEAGLILGQRVNHKIFGDGVVLNLEGSGPNSRVQVNFDGEGSKWLVAAFANLEPV